MLSMNTRAVIARSPLLIRFEHSLSTGDAAILSVRPVNAGKDEIATPLDKLGARNDSIEGQTCLTQFYLT
jgi:hypothetical protein